MTKLSETLPIEEARERLRQLISELAVVRGKVTLASGKEADYYVDLRRITLHHEASRLVGQVMLDLLDRNGIEFEAAGGLTMGADPVGSAIMRAAGDQDRAIDSFVVRKAQKSYGMGRQVEGPSVEGPSRRFSVTRRGCAAHSGRRGRRRRRHCRPCNRGERTYRRGCRGPLLLRLLQG